MFKRILICTDGSDSALDAARTAAAIARSFSSEVLALNVFHLGFADPANIGVWAIAVDQDVIERCARQQRMAVEPVIVSVFEDLNIPCRFVQEAAF